MKPRGRPKKETTVKKLSPELEAMLAKLDPDEAKTVRAALVDDAADKEVAKQMKSESDRQSREKHYWITLIRLPDDNEPFAFVGAAGVAYKMDKGVRMPVPESVINALRYAKVDGYIPVIDEHTGQSRQKRVSYDRYPFQLDGECSLAQVQAWREAEQAKARKREGLIVETREEEIEGRPQIEFGPMQQMGAGEE